MPLRFREAATKTRLGALRERCRHLKHAFYVHSSYKYSAVAEMSDRLATIDMAEKRRGYCARFGRGSWVPI